jgi:hypothetical protein
MTRTRTRSSPPASSLIGAGSSLLAAAPVVGAVVTLAGDPRGASETPPPIARDDVPPAVPGSPRSPEFAQADEQKVLPDGVVTAAMSSDSHPHVQICMIDGGCAPEVVQCRLEVLGLWREP